MVGAEAEEVCDATWADAGGVLDGLGGVAGEEEGAAATVVGARGGGAGSRAWSMGRWPRAPALA